MPTGFASAPHLLAALALCLGLAAHPAGPACAQTPSAKTPGGPGVPIPSALIYQPGQLKPVDSQLAVKVGDKAPDFDLPGISGKRVALSDYLGKKNVVLSFIPAAWTPVCSGQWPGYNFAREVFESKDAVLIGISCDNIPALNAWVVEMGGVWFPVASDFWPHGGLSKKFGVLRSDGTSERAIVIIDKQGIIRFIDVSDINLRPDLGKLSQALSGLK
ncbi:MAG: peroxiredoxin [Acidobacteriota bacterium]